MLVALVVSGAAACIIGPKQDDPAEDRAVPGEDVGFNADAAGSDGAVAVDDDAMWGGNGDTSTAAPEGGSTDTGGDAPADGVSDAPCGDGNTEAGDACPTGGTDAISAD